MTWNRSRHLDKQLTDTFSDAELVITLHFLLKIVRHFGKMRQKRVWNERVNVFHDIRGLWRQHVTFDSFVNVVIVSLKKRILTPISHPSRLALDTSQKVENCRK